MLRERPVRQPTKSQSTASATLTRAHSRKHKEYAGEQTSFSYAHEEPRGQEPGFILDESLQSGDDSPSDGQNRQPNCRIELFENNVGWHFEQAVTDKVQCQCRVVDAAVRDADIGQKTETVEHMQRIVQSGSVTRLLRKVAFGNSHPGVSDIASIKEREQIQEREARKQLPINLADQRSFLFGRVVDEEMLVRGGGRVWQTQSLER